MLWYDGNFSKKKQEEEEAVEERLNGIEWNGMEWRWLCIDVFTKPDEQACWLYITTFRESSEWLQTRNAT